MLNFLKFIFPDFTFYFGGGSPGPTTTKSETSNIPEYARPYVERMMGSTEKQIYTYGDKGQITGFQPYKPFQGETVAGFSPMQARAMQGIGNYQLPGQTGAATGLTSMGTLASMGAGSQAMGAGANYANQATDPNAMQSYMSPYMENALQPQMREAARMSAIQRQSNMAEAAKQGAFGGSRQGLIEAERQRNLAQQQGDIYGRGMQTAFEQARQAQQFGAELGLKGIETGLRGYSQGLQGAGQLGALGEQQYKQELGLLGQQMGVGEKQQQYEQNRLNQKIQDYATAQQYPFIQLGTLSNMLRGLPMQASTTQMYQAQPSFLQQGIGLAGAGANLYQAMKAEGGEIKEMASGGIATGADPYKLPGMMKKLSDDQLKDKMGGDTDPETLGIAQAEKKRRDQVRGMAGGGAVAFAKGGIDEVDNPFEKTKPKEEEKPVAKKEAPAPKALVAKAPVSATPYQDMARAQLTALDKPVPEVEKTRAAVKALEERTAGGVEGEMDRRQAVYQKFGVDPVKMIAEERARHQEELKLSEEDYRKAQHLRYAQMFAQFGSTPGPVLKAALVAINGVVPDLLDDKAKANAVRRDIKKAMFELDKSEYLEKKGNVDKATEAHESAVARITSMNMDLGKMVTDTELKKTQVKGGLAEREMAGMSAEKTAGISAAASRYAADKREIGETKRAEIREASELRKEEERKSRDTNSYLSAMGKWDKENKEELAPLEQAIRFAKNQNDPNIVIMKEQLAKKRQERMAYEAEVRRAFPDARTSSDAAPAGDIDKSNPLLK